MNRVRFEGFSPALFTFLSELANNNNKPWFDEHRREYESEVLLPVKAFVAELGAIIRMLNEEFETEPRVGRTISRINNDIRFRKNIPPYRPFIYVAFPRRGQRWTDSAVLYAGIHPKGLSIGFYPGGHKELRTGPVQQAIKQNARLFQSYLDRRNVVRTYWELTSADDGRVTKWPLPETARRWVNLDGFNVGEFFPSSDRRLFKRSFLDVAQKIFLDLYPLWLFSSSEDLKTDWNLYSENVERLSRPVSKQTAR